MKVLVIPDIHLKPWIFDKAEAILQGRHADKAVCLMDIPDDWGKQLSITSYKETYDRVIKFAKDFPDTLWCYGNHDLSYLWGKLETGYSPYAEKTIIKRQDELKDALRDPSQLSIIHRIDNVLFMHGGLSEQFVKRLNKDMIYADVDKIIKKINELPPEILWIDGSPLWLRPQYGKLKIYGAEQYIQVVGHTPVEKIYKRGAVISTDTFSTYQNGKQIGESTMLVIETETKKYEIISV